MAISGPLKVDFADVFPFGLGVVGPVEPMRDFDASTADRPVQARDKDTGQPIWQVDCMDFDPDARERTLKVKIISPVQPVPPAVVEGTPVRPVVLENLTLTAYVKEGNRPKVGWSLRCTGLAALGRAANKNVSAA